MRIVAVATPTAATMLAAVEDTDIPVVYSAVTDPAAAGFDGEENITGTSDALNTEAIMNLITAVNPDIDTIGLLYDRVRMPPRRPLPMPRPSATPTASSTLRRTAPPPPRCRWLPKPRLLSGVMPCSTSLTNTAMTAERPSTQTFTEQACTLHRCRQLCTERGLFRLAADYVQPGEATPTWWCEILSRDGKDYADLALPDL